MQPSFTDIAYGPHEQHRLDLWLAQPTPAPLVVAIHGGGWYKGDKQEVQKWDLINGCRTAGIAVAAINYRLAHPAPTAMLDCADAINFLRLHAHDWGLDPTRIAAAGTSAGGLNALWVAFRDGLAGVFTVNTPTFLDATSPFAGEVPAAAFAHEGIRLLGAKVREASPLYLAHPHAPPVFMLYGQRRALPGPNVTPGVAIHHGSFGVVLQRHLPNCIVRCRDDYSETNEDDFNRRWRADRLQFFQRVLTARHTK